MNIIESLRKFISMCPYLYEFNESINVDYLSDEYGSYSVEEVPTDPITKKYLDGSSERQFDFIFCSRESYGADVFQNIENSGFYENFSDWVEGCSNRGILPELGENREALRIETTTGGYAFATDINQARYQIQLKLIYLQKKI